MNALDLIKRHPIYEALHPQMLSYQYAYLGGDIFKRHVRRKRPSEDANLYRDLIDNTVAQPMARYVVDTINDVLFEPGVTRDLKFCTPTGQFINEDNLDWPDLMILDSDLQNRTLDAFMEHVGDLTSIYGHCWVFVDMPRQEEGNLGRPYVVAINPLDVYDWEFSYHAGKSLVQYCKVLESETDTHLYFKCYYLGDETTPSHWTSYQVHKDIDKNEVFVTGEGSYPPGMAIPGFIAYGRRDPRRIDVGISDIDAVTDAQREYYKLECESYSSIQFAKTIIRAEKGIQVPVHAGSIVRATEGQIEAIPVDTGDVNKIIEKQTQILEQIESLTGLGGLRNSSKQVASGISIIEERKQLHRLAKAKARLMETVEELIFTFAARFMGMRWGGNIYYNTDYEAHDTNYRLALMKEAKALDPDNPIINALITKEIIGILSPTEAGTVYEGAYIDSIEDANLKNILTREESQVFSRDLADQVPKSTPDIEAEREETQQEGRVLTTNPIDTGTSYSTQQALAVQLQGTNTGR